MIGMLDAAVARLQLSRGGMSIRTLSARSGVARANLTALFAGRYKRGPGVDAWVQLARAVDVDPRWLIFGGSDAEEAAETATG